MIDPLNSRRNRPDLRSNSKAIKNAVRPLFFKFLERQLSEGRRRQKASDRPIYFRHLENIFSDLYSAWMDDPAKAVGYSRGKANFTRGGAYWDHVGDRSLLSYRIYIDLIDFLMTEGFIENQVARSGKSAFSSRMRARPPLINLLEENQVTWADIGFDSNINAIVVKDERKRPIHPPEDSRFDLKRAEANLQRINENLLTTFINLHVTDETFDAIHRQITRYDEPDDEDFREPLEFSNRRLRRVFANGTYDAGGRFYGGWWQGLPSEYRKHIEIDGAVTVELDYSTIQPRILYAKVKAEPPDDSYRVPGWPEDLRPIIKKAFNQLVNCSESTRSPKQWHLLAPALDPHPLPKNWANLNKFQRTKPRRDFFLKQTGKSYDELLSDLLLLHDPIDKFFFSGSWTWMQRMDSDIAEKVMLRLLDMPLTVLPIHDSFIVRRGGEGALIEVMNEAFSEVIGTDAKVDRSDALFPSPFEPGPPLPPEKSLIWARDIMDEVRSDMVLSSQYHRNEAIWQRVHGPL